MAEASFAHRRAALVALIVMLVSLGTFLFRVHEIFAYTLDDSFITFRYATHAAQGDGVTWNIGEIPPTEGCTSFLWLATLSVACWLRMDIEAAAKLLGIVSILLTAALVFVAILRSTNHDQPRSTRFTASCLGATLFLLNAHLPAHAVSGMETASALILMTLLFVVLAEYLRRPRSLTACGAGVAALLLGMTRPELNLAAVVAILIALILTTERSRLLLCGLAPYLGGGGIYFIWRWSYFGLPFPLPFYVKQMGHGFLPGLLPTGAYVLYLWPLYVLLGVFALGLLRSHRAWLPAAAGAAVTGLYFILPAHIMGGDYRFVFPTYGVVAVFSGLGMVPLMARPSRSRPALLAGIVMILAVFAIQQQVRYRLVRSTTMTDARGLNAAHIPLGRVLASIDSKGGHLLAISDAGAVPFYSAWPTLDTFGLNDRAIALSLRSGYDPELVFSREPELIVLISNTENLFDPPLAFEGLIYSACPAHGYQRIGTLTYSSEYFLWLMVRDARFADALQAELAGKVPAFAE